MKMRKLTGKAAILAAAIGASAAISTFATPTPENTPDYFVDWVRSRSNLYVDTGVAGKVGVKAEVSFYYIQHDTYPVMLGAWGAEKERFNLVMHENKRCRWEYGHYDSGQFSNPAMTGMDSNGVNVSMDTEYGTLCDVTVECSATGAMSSTWTGSAGNSITATMNASEKYGIIDTQATLFLFAAHRKNGSTDGPSQYAYGILRSCKLWTDYDGTGTWTPARDLRPCVKNGRAGLYDAVTEEILYPQGNELEAGPAKLDSGYALGSNAHPGTQWGRIDYRGKGTRSDGGRDDMGNSQWMHLLLTDYTAKGAGDIANLNGGNTSWQGSNLKWSQVRFDGWFQVSSDKAGTWKINQKYDDYFAISIDGRNVLFNNSYTGEANSTLAVTEGWHRFTIIAGDTYGGYGCNKDYGSLGSIPFSVSVNDGAAMAFNTSNFPQGSGSNSYTLTSDEDWSDRGPILLSGGAVLDLNGCNLVVKDIACDDFVGSCITNSASKKSVLYFAGKPLETKAYVDSLIKEVDVKIILAQDGDQVATWTGAVSGDPANASNWEDLAGEPVVPTASYTVKIAGNNVNLQAPAGTDIACKAFEIGNCTLATDCDWRGLSHTPLLVGTANLNGHVLTLNHLSANAGSTFSGGDGSTVTFDAADTSYGTFSEATFIDNFSSLTKSGSVKILFPKTGSGTLTASTALNIGTTSGGSTEFYQTDGSVSVGAFRVSTVDGGSAIYAMSNGTLTASSDFEIGGRGVGDFIQTGGTATLDSWLNLGRYGGRGTLTVNGGRMVNTLNKEVYVGCVGGTGIVNVGGSGELEVHQLPIGGGWDGNQKGYLNISGNGSVKTRSWVALANHNTSNNRTGYGEVNQSGGTFTVGSDFTVGENNRGTGVYNLTAGALSVSGLLRIGWHDGSTGTFTQNAGTVTVTKASAYVGIGQSSGSVGTYTLNGGTLVTPQVKQGEGKGTLILNGGMIVATNVTDGANFITGLNNVTYGPGGLTLDTAAYNVTMATASGANVTAAAGSTFTKTGSGTLTVAAVPPVGNMVVSSGTLAVSSGTAYPATNAESGNTYTASPSSELLANDYLLHRWNFNGHTLDLVGNNDAVVSGSNVGGAVQSATSITLPGGARGTCWMDCGSNIIPTELGDTPFTIEFWATPTSIDDWRQWFALGNSSDPNGTGGLLSGFCMAAKSGSGNGANVGLAGATSGNGNHMVGEAKLTVGKEYHVAVAVTPKGNSAATISVYIEDTTGADAEGHEAIRTTTFDVGGWSTATIVQSNFWLGHSHWGNWDVASSYNEMRVWAAALSQAQVEANGRLGADTLPVFTDRCSLGMAKNVEIASGATLSIASGQTLTQPVVKGSGTIATGAGGSLVVSDKIVVNVGEYIEASGTIDLSNAKIELADPENLVSPFTFLKPTAGQTLTVTGVPTPTNLPKGWKVSVSPSGTCRIVKRGFMIFVK